MNANTAMQYRVLGPLEVLSKDRALPLGGQQQYLLLAALLARANSVVSADTLVNVLWGDDPPAGDGSTQLAKSIYRLRSTLASVGAAECLTTRRPGYRLSVSADGLDADRFAAMLVAGQRLVHADTRAAIEEFDKALELWRGPAWSDVADHDFFRADAARLEELRATAVEARADAMLGIGRHEALIAELELVTQRYPLRERPRAQLMLALYRSGRQAEALSAYQSFRRYLLDELGLEPSADLRRVERDILEHRSSAVGQPGTNPVRATATRPDEGLSAFVADAAADERSSVILDVIGPAGMRRERKVVTVLFVDLVGFTARSEAMDPEDVELELGRYHAGVRRDLERHGGTVEKFIGDAVMAVFGAPIAHEDDAERAVRAALAVRDWASSDGGFEVRIGVHTGEALVRLDAHAEAGEGIAAGDVVNTASRLQSAAPANGIVVGEPTYRATNSVIEYRAAEPVIAKGKSTPILIWEAVGARSRLGVEVEPVPRGTFVGRENELGLLRGALTRACEEREPQLVTLVGVPGIGKSRLVYELSRIVDAEPDLVTWRQGRCFSYGEEVSLWALAEITKAQTGILETDMPGAAEKKLAKAVDALAFGGDRKWLMTHLRPLLGLSSADTSPTNRDEQFAAWRRFLEALAESQPAVLVFEDLHWADDLLLDFLEEFAALVTGVPLLILCTARPELLAKRPNWGAGQTNTLTLSVPPLSTADTNTLMRELLASAIPEAVRQAVLERADGNPLYAEEFVRLIADRSAPHLGIPETIQAILAARLDTLASEQKRLLQAAAVIGKVFWVGALAACVGLGRRTVDQLLHELGRRELVRRERRSTVADDTAYTFRHVLVRDVAYSQIPRADRSSLHRKAAEWIGAVARPEDYAELIAYHYRSALEYARLASRDPGALSEATRTALRRAGDRAVALGAHASAAEFFQQALELAGTETEHAQLLVAHGKAQWLHSGEALDRVAEGARELEKLGRLEDAADAMVFVARSEVTQGGPEAAERWLDDADRLVAGLRDSPVRYQALFARAGLCLTYGDYERASALITPRLPEIQRLDQPHLLARALDLAGSALSARGDPGGLEYQWRAVEVARESRAVWELQTALHNLGGALTGLGRVTAVGRVHTLLQEAFDTFGASAGDRVLFSFWAALHEYGQGAWDSALNRVNELLSVSTDGGSFLNHVAMLLLRTEILVARDEQYDPRQDVHDALSLAQSMDGSGRARLGNLPDAAQALAVGGATDQAFPLWEETRAHLVSGDGTVQDDEMITFAWTATRLGREADALAALPHLPQTPWRDAAAAILGHEFARAADMLTEMGYPLGAAQAGLLAGGQHVQRALEFFRSIAATRYVAIGEAAILRGTDANDS